MQFLHTNESPPKLNMICVSNKENCLNPAKTKGKDMTDTIFPEKNEVHSIHPSLKVPDILESSHQYSASYRFLSML